MSINSQTNSQTNSQWRSFVTNHTFQPSYSSQQPRKRDSISVSLPNTRIISTQYYCVILWNNLHVKTAVDIIGNGHALDGIDRTPTKNKHYICALTLQTRPQWTTAVLYLFCSTSLCNCPVCSADSCFTNTPSSFDFNIIFWIHIFLRARGPSLFSQSIHFLSHQTCGYTPDVTDQLYTYHGHLRFQFPFLWSTISLPCSQLLGFLTTYEISYDIHLFFGN